MVNLHSLSRSEGNSVRSLERNYGEAKDHYKKKRKNLPKDLRTLKAILIIFYQI